MLAVLCKDLTRPSCRHYYKLELHDVGKDAIYIKHVEYSHLTKYSANALLNELIDYADTEKK